MAYPSWLTVTPASGSGDGSISVSGTANTGRSARSYGNGTSTGIKVVAGSITKYIKVTQAAKAEFVSFAQTTYSAAADATSVTLTGTSNCANLTFSLIGATTVTAAGTNCQMNFYESSTNKGTTYKSETSKYIAFEKVSTTDTTGIKYTGAGAAQKSGVALSGDPGAASQYTFSITLTFSAANSGSTKEVAQLKVQGSSASVVATASIERNAASVFLNLSATSVDLVTAGTAKTVTVDSNGSWSVSGT